MPVVSSHLERAPEIKGNRKRNNRPVACLYAFLSRTHSQPLLDKAGKFQHCYAKSALLALKSINDVSPQPLKSFLVHVFWLCHRVRPQG